MPDPVTTTSVMTPKWKEREFWVMIAGWVIGTLLSSGAIVENSLVWKVLGVATAILTTLGFQISRGLAKSG